MPKINPNYQPIKYGKTSKSTSIKASLANFAPGEINTVSVQSGYDARAVVMPPGSIVGIDDDFTVVAYVTETMSPASLLIPNVTGIVVVDLPNGMLPPAGSDKGTTIYDAITSAIMKQLEPPKPGGTGNDNPVP